MKNRAHVKEQKVRPVYRAMQGLLWVSAMVAMTMLAIPGAHAQDGRKTGPVSLVNTFIGTGTKTDVFGYGNTFPGAAMPFGMLTWSPATTSRHPGGGYFYPDHEITGFSLTHLSGAGCNSGGVVPILPMVGAVGPQPGKLMEPFEHAHETASPGYYAVTLAPDTAKAIQVQMAVTTRTGIGVFKFPENPRANFLFKVSSAQGTSSTSAVRIIGDDALAGSVTAGHFCGTAGGVTTYFVAKFNRPFRSFGVWSGKNGRLQADVRQKVAAATGAWVSFDASHMQTVELKVAISYVSVANAWANLRAENKGWNFRKVARNAGNAWEEMLSRLEVGGGTHEQKVMFYTALYHALLDPNVFSDVNGRYIGFDNKVHELPSSQAEQYANFSGWDIYRSEIPLLAMIVPGRMKDMVSSLLNDKKQGGWLPKWGFANTYTGTMAGDSADPIIAGAYAFGVRGFDTGAALSAMVKGATDMGSRGSRVKVRYRERPHLLAYRHFGYVPDSSSRTSASNTLEYAIDDFAIARFAKALGKEKIYRKFNEYAGNWKHVFDRSAEFRGFKGYMMPRSTSGTFPSGPAFQLLPESVFRWQPGFTEGNTIQYTWFVPQDYADLIRLMGGDARVNARLDILFKHLNAGERSPYYWGGNETTLEIPWIYDYTGQPWKTQQVVHRILSTLYSNSPGGLPGNDDLGSMSSWLIWADIGLYPETPGTDVLVLGAPVFSHITMHLQNGHKLVIDAPRTSIHSLVHGLRIDGKPWTKVWLHASMLLNGDSGHQTTYLKFSMSSQPDRRWGVGTKSRPPSWPSPTVSRHGHANHH